MEDKWIRVEDRLPTNNDPIFQLIWGEDEDGDIEVYKAYYSEQSTCWFWRDMEFSNVTHWMPLPEPPKQ